MTSGKPSRRARSAAKSSASRAAPDAVDLVAARIAAACDMLEVPRGASSIVVACSGGSDSAATLLGVRLARPQACIHACYVDHRMRPPESIARDRSAVRAQARTADAEFKTLRIDSPVRRGESREAWLRSQRYRELAAFARTVGATVVVTGHQRDDVAESTIIALLRGSGVDGIAAMQPRRSLGDGVHLVRPALWASKQVLADFSEAHGLTISEDESNDDLGLRRNAVRKLLLDLERISAGARRAIARTAAIAAGDRALLAGVARAAWRAVRSQDGHSLIAASVRKLPDALVRRVLRIEVARVAGSSKDLSFAQCAAIARAMRESRGGVFDAGHARALLSAGRLTLSLPSDHTHDEQDRLRIAAPRVRTSVEWNGGRIELRRVGGSQAASRRRREQTSSSRSRATGAKSVSIDATGLPAGTNLTIRRPATGDQFTPAGRHTEVPLARFLAKEGLTRDERRLVPLLCADGTIAAVIGVRAGAAFAPRPAAGTIDITWVASQHGQRDARRR